MAWEWVAPVATAAVGIVGVAATFFSGERARRAQAQVAEDTRTAAREDKLRDERREAYMRFLTALETVEDLLKTISRAARITDDPSEPEVRRARSQKRLVEAMAAATPAGKALQSAGMFTLLVAPSSVRANTIAVLLAYDDDARKAATGAEVGIPLEVLAPLRHAMRQDLGIPPVEDGFSA